MPDPDSKAAQVARLCFALHSEVEATIKEPGNSAWLKQNKEVQQLVDAMKRPTRDWLAAHDKSYYAEHLGNNLRGARLLPREERHNVLDSAMRSDFGPWLQRVFFDYYGRKSQVFTAAIEQGRFGTLQRYLPPAEQARQIQPSPPAPGRSLPAPSPTVQQGPQSPPAAQPPSSPGDGDYSRATSPPRPSPQLAATPAPGNYDWAGLPVTSPRETRAQAAALPTSRPVTPQPAPAARSTNPFARTNTPARTNPFSQQTTPGGR